MDFDVVKVLVKTGAGVVMLFLAAAFIVGLVVGRVILR
jgi:hypothetical protein